MRATIAAIPDGDYAFEDRLDDDGFSPASIAIRVRLTIAGDTATVDFTGSDPQTTGGVNANFAITLSATLYVFRCLVREDVLYNAGIGRAVRVWRRRAPSSTPGGRRRWRRQRRDVAAHHRRRARRAGARAAGACRRRARGR